MKKRIKRLMALLLAVLMVVGLLPGNQLTTLQAEAVELGTEETPETSGDENPSNPPETKVTYVFTLNLTGKVDSVGFGDNATVTVKNNSKNVGTARITDAITNVSWEGNSSESTDDYVYEISGLENYTVQSSGKFNFASDSTKYAANVGLTPQYELKEISGAEKLIELIVGTSTTFTLQKEGSDVWNDKVVWTLDTKGHNSEVELINAVSGNVSGNSCTVKVADELNADSFIVTLNAKDVNNNTITKDITISKEDTTVSLKASPEEQSWKKDVELTATVDNENANGGKIKFYCIINNEWIFIGSDEVKNKTASIKQYLLGKNINYTFKAVYEGNKKVKTGEESIIEYTPGKADPEPFTVEEISSEEIRYGQKEITIATITDGDEEKRDNVTFTVITLNREYKSGDFKVERDENNKNKYLVKMNAVAAGDVEFQIRKESDNDYKEATSKKYTITVAKEELELTNITAVDKVYDGKKDNIRVNATINKDDLLDADKNKIKDDTELNLTVDNASVKDENAGNSKEVTVTFTLPENNIWNNYTLKDKGKCSATVNITQRPLYLTTGDAVKHWNKDEFTEAVTVNLLDDTGYSSTNENSGLVGDKPSEFKLPEAIIDTEVCTNAGVMGAYLNAVTVDKSSGKATDNYVFEINNDNKGKLTIDGEDVFGDEGNNYCNYLELDNSGSTHVYQDDKDKNYTLYFGDNSQAKLDIKKDPYTKIKYAISGDNYSDLNEKLNLTGDDNQNIKFILSNDDESKQTQPFALTFKRDDTNPDVSIKIGKRDSVVKTFTDAITFNFFSNGENNSDYLQAKIKVEDPSKDENSNSINCSGMKSWSYVVVDTEKDVNFSKETITEDMVTEMFEGYTFKNVNDVNNELTIDIGKVENKNQAGNYIVFVLATDNVGNSVLYSSNGIVLDNINLASITVDYDNDKTENKPDYFKGTVNLKATVTEDTCSIFSGVKDLTYTVTKDGQTGDVLSLLSEDDPETTLENLKNAYGIKTKDFSIGLEDNNHSREITLNFTAHDFAGNKLTQTKSFVIDPVAPTIENTISSEAKRLNGKYYNKNVVVTTEITERFLDINNDVEYSIKIDNQDAERVTLAKLIEEKDKYGISEITVEHETDQTKKKDQSVSTIKITFAADHDYIIQTNVKDMAGNEGHTGEDEFVVDQTAPVVNMTYYRYGTGENFVPSTSEEEPTYLNENYSSFKMRIEINELNFSKDSKVDADIKVDAKDSGNKTIYKDVTDQIAEDAKNDRPETWEVADTKHTFEVLFTEDANYSLAFNYTDLAGNPVVINPVYITLDKTKPTGSVTISGLVNGNAIETWKSFISKITFNLFGKNSVGGSVTSEDATAGVRATQYYVTNQLLTKSALESLEVSQWTNYVRPLTINANENIILYEKVTDKAGNVEYFSSENIVIDNTNPAPTVTITPSSPAHGMGVYAAGDNPGFDIRVTDASVTADQNAYAGLKEISYRIVNGTTGYVETGVLASFVRTTHQSEWTGHVNINPELFYSNDVQVTVTASDWSTNETTTEKTTLKVDNKAPIVKFAFDTSDALNGKYYKNNKMLTITVDERNFDTSFTPTVTSSAGGGYSFSGWSSNGEIHTGTVTFSGDSDYTVTFDCVDLAGNRSNTENLTQFTVDKTLPVINVSYSNNSAQNGNYYKASRTATITITEHNFNASEVRVTTTAALNETSIAAPTVSGWSTSGDRHTATISYAKDGDFTFDIAYSDLAGNAAADYAMDRFTVDLTNPEIKFSGVEDKSANKGTVAPVIDLTDTNFNTQDVTLTLTGAKKGKVSTEGMLSIASIGNGQRITFQNFAEKQDMDDIYTLTAKSVDKAGNETTNSITFSVNRFGSTFKFGDATQKLIKSGFTNKEQEIVITEINVDTLESVQLTYSKDGNIVTLVKDVDYTVQESGGNGQWKEYTYTIKASCFAEEGEYKINVTSVDRAENNNICNATPVEFIVDKTAPSMSIANLEDRHRYKENAHEFTLTVKDNTVLSYVEVYLDGQLWHTYTADELSVVDGQVVITVDSKSTYQDVKIIAYDAAGNATDPVQYQVLVTTNAWILFFNNKPLFIGSIAVVVLIAAGIILLVYKRRKHSN